MKILHLTLKKKWFDMILSGEKREEYRAIKRYWCRRLMVAWFWDNTLDRLHVPTLRGYKNGDFRHFDAIEFRNGYSKTAPTMLVECKGISTGIGNPAWGAPSEPVFIIKCGKVLETKNI